MSTSSDIATIEVALLNRSDGTAAAASKALDRIRRTIGRLRAALKPDLRIEIVALHGNIADKVAEVDESLRKLRAEIKRLIVASDAALKDSE